MARELDQLEMTPGGPVSGTIRPPGSKSITNRALVCAALADGRSILHGALDSEDTRVMVEGWSKLGVRVDFDPATATITVHGRGGRIPMAAADLYCANSGTTIRFLAAAIALGHGRYRLDGTARMRERPIGDLLDALRQFGITATSERNNGCPPVVIEADGLPGGTATVRGNLSSQFLSGLLLAAPYARQDVTLTVEGELVSAPYVGLTLEMMQGFGVRLDVDETFRRFHIPSRQVYAARDYEIEPDASAASYFWAAAAITGGTVTVQGLWRNGSDLQGDVCFVDLLEWMGCEMHESAEGTTIVGRPLKGITADMSHISDTAQTLAVVALFADGPTTITGVAHNRLKETDRIGNLAVELRKLGATVEETEDGLRIIPGPLRGATIETYQDHRMAMSLALAGLRVRGVVIRDPGCTVKTYPRFFDDLARLRGHTGSGQ